MLASPALFRKQTRGWVIVLMLMVLCDGMAFFAGGISQHVIFPGHALHYNWGYKVFSLAFGLMFAIILIDSGKFRSRELGLSFLQAPGTGRMLLTVILPCLVLLVVLPAMPRGAKDHSLETVLFQATMPGLTEELAFRGLYLALFDRMFTARFRVFGAELGYGAIATSLVFAMAHVVRFDAHFIPQVAIVPGITMTLFALFMVWVRCRSRSLVLPVMLHNLGNTIPYIMPKML
ncbi:MAG: CPBP family intramembrane metalloprotease [Rhizomicrobium sp.]|nr:CPBP family intramembrane metalloprotease [Rhizomicrobium sp.]